MAAARPAPARLAAGTGDHGPTARVPPRMMTSIAPSEAPAETPSVNGVASGLRSSAWNTTPADASAAPTSAPASMRGRRAMNRICASTLLANGIDESSARRRLMGELPTSGATTQVTSVSAPNPRMVSASRVRIGRDGASGARKAEWVSLAIIPPAAPVSP